MLVDSQSKLLSMYAVYEVDSALPHLIMESEKDSETLQ